MASHGAPFAMLLTLLVLAFAGCVAEDDAKTASTVQPVAKAEFDADTGSILGIVLNEDKLPIAGASVGILEPPVEAVSDASGGFALNRLAPGTYQVHASALGFKSASKPVEVVAGQVTEAEFVLETQASTGPYHEIDIKRIQISGALWKLTPTCIYEPLTSVNPLLKTCGGLRLAGEGEFHYTADQVTNEWKTILSEVAWQPQSGVSGRGWNHDVNAPNVTRGSGGAINQADPRTFQEDSAVSPIIIRIDNPTTMVERGIAEEDWYADPGCSANNCDWFWRMFPGACDLGSCYDGPYPDYGVMQDGVADVYFTYFIREAAPEGYTSLPQE